ncbi:hypothetical protein chiPu_0028446 [Chiloscyllium punctatum]|uniref:Uncharacterized protein n=1 Tax=Chiloscyllium punctatum TaxID=137246 RepID=A0A401TPE1_CHIPU|nr:hypothetical protein [Chiloscyllium punctatum]
MVVEQSPPPFCLFVSNQSVRTLRNILHWISHIGVMCNKELGEPYKKCIKVFDDAINHCFSLLSIFGFLCYIVNIIKPLCGLATGEHQQGIVGAGSQLVSPQTGNSDHNRQATAIRTGRQ